MKKLLLIISLFSMSLNAEESQDLSVNVEEQVQPNTNEENLQKLINLTANKDQIANGSRAIFQQTLAQLPAEAQKNIPTLEKMVERMIEKYSSKESMAEFAAIYSKYYTNEEIADILKFYESETGKKVLKTMPQVSAEAAQIGFRTIQELMSEFFPAESKKSETQN
jgi:hypothetical protein